MMLCNVVYLMNRVSILVSAEMTGHFILTLITVFDFETLCFDCLSHV